jgi:hypothetical protein
MEPRYGTLITPAARHIRRKKLPMSSSASHRSTPTFTVSGDKSPAYQWYPKDYDSDEAVKLMTYEQEGIYRRLLDHQALHGSIPAEPTQIAMLVPKVPLRRFLSLWTGIAGKFTCADGRLVNQKLERVKANTAAFKAAKTAAGLASAAARAEQNGGKA